MPASRPASRSPIAMAGCRTTELPAWGLELLETEPVAHLGLLDESDRPRVLPVTFALAEGRIWSAVDQKPKRSRGELARVRFLRRDPRAALTVDRYSDDWGRLAWVQVLGEIQIIAADEAPGALESLSSKYAQYRQASPPGPLLSLEPERCLCWSARAGDEFADRPRSQ
jgi:PPOX class probable F420-dependent enzyme